MKICKKCNKELELYCFTTEKSRNCIDCKSKIKVDWYIKNKTRILEDYKEKYRLNPDYYKNKSKLINKEIKKERDKLYYNKNKVKINLKNKEYVEKNKVKTAEYKKQWSLKNKEKLKEKRRLYRLKNKDNRNKKTKTRTQKDPIFALTISLRKNILKSFRDRGYSKNSNTANILGCSFENFKVFIENQFEPWMNWENRGLYNGEFNYGWDLDHIIPLCTAKTEEDVKALNHFSNLRPLCSKKNRDIKKGRVE